MIPAWVWYAGAAAVVLLVVGKPRPGSKRNPVVGRAAAEALASLEPGRDVWYSAVSGGPPIGNVTFGGGGGAP